MLTKGNMLLAFPAPLAEERLGDASLGPLAPAIGVRFPVLGQVGCKVFSGRPLGLPGQAVRSPGLAADLTADLSLASVHRAVPLHAWLRRPHLQRVPGALLGGPQRGVPR